VVIDSGNNTVQSNVLKMTIQQNILPLYAFYYEGIWSCPDPVHDPEINSWVDYIDENGNQQREIIGCAENGCQLVMANSIVDTNGVTTCSNEICLRFSWSQDPNQFSSLSDKVVYLDCVTGLEVELYPSAQVQTDGEFCATQIVQIEIKDESMEILNSLNPAFHLWAVTMER